jgi:hypothetical protein
VIDAAARARDRPAGEASAVRGQTRARARRRRRRGAGDSPRGCSEGWRALTTMSASVRVFRVARNAIVDHHRSTARHPRVEGQAPDEVATQLVEEDENRVELELASHIAPFVAALPSPYREALTLTELEGITQKDAAIMLGVSLSTMKSVCSAAACVFVESSRHAVRSRSTFAVA